MPQDKRLIVTKAVVHKIQRLRGGVEVASEEGIFIEFVVPSVVITQSPELLEKHVFELPKRTYLMNGRTSCLIVPRVISGDAFKINKRHGYYDAVITAEAICKRDDNEAARRAIQVARTFSHFVVDARIVSKLPPCILTVTSSKGVGVGKNTSSSSSSLLNNNNNNNTGDTSRGGKRDNNTSNKSSSNKKDNNNNNNNNNNMNSIKPTSDTTHTLAPTARKCLTAIYNLDDLTSLTFRLSQGATGGVVRAKQQGQLMFRVGHGGMTAGEVCENAKCFIFALKRDFPMVWKYIHEFKMTSTVTEPIRFMEVQIQK